MIAGKQSSWLGIQGAFMDDVIRWILHILMRSDARSAQYPDTQQTVTFISDNGEHLAWFYVRGKGKHIKNVSFRDTFLTYKSFIWLRLTVKWMYQMYRPPRILISSCKGSIIPWGKWSERDGNKCSLKLITFISKIWLIDASILLLNLVLENLWLQFPYFSLNNSILLLFLSSIQKLSFDSLTSWTEMSVYLIQFLSPESRQFLAVIRI